MIQFVNVHKSFGEKRVLAGLDLEVAPGETFAVLGPTGVGKSVMLKCVVGLIRPDSGQVCVDGEDVTAFPERDMARIRLKCGMVFQLPTLFDSLTILENVGYGLRRHKKMKGAALEEAVAEFLRLVELDPSIMDKMPAHLSYGEQKRVGLARTLALRPSCLLYDEPTTGLDPLTAESINQLIRNLAEKLNVTSIVVTHDIRTVEVVADRVGLIHDGQLKHIHTPRYFFEDSPPLVMDFLYGEHSP